MIKSLVVACLTTAATLGAGAAHAAHVAWSIGIDTPVIGTVVSNAPFYGPVYERAYEPVYAPVPRYAPVPVYLPAPPVAYYPRSDVYYRPAPIVVPRYFPRYGHPGWNRGRWYRDHDHGRWDDHGRR